MSERRPRAVPLVAIVLGAIGLIVGVLIGIYLGTRSYQHEDGLAIPRGWMLVVGGDRKVSYVTTEAELGTRMDGLQYVIRNTDYTFETLGLTSDGRLATLASRQVPELCVARLEEDRRWRLSILRVPGLAQSRTCPMASGDVFVGVVDATRSQVVRVDGASGEAGPPLVEERSWSRTRMHRSFDGRFLALDGPDDEPLVILRTSDDAREVVPERAGRPLGWLADGGLVTFEKAPRGPAVRMQVLRPAADAPGTWQIVWAFTKVAKRSSTFVSVSPDGESLLRMDRGFGGRSLHLEAVGYRGSRRLDWDDRTVLRRFDDPTIQWVRR